MVSMWRSTLVLLLLTVSGTAVAIWTWPLDGGATQDPPRRAPVVLPPATPPSPRAPVLVAPSAAARQLREYVLDTKVPLEDLPRHVGFDRAGIEAHRNEIIDLCRRPAAGDTAPPAALFGEDRLRQALVSYLEDRPPSGRGCLHVQHDPARLEVVLPGHPEVRLSQWVEAKGALPWKVSTGGRSSETWDRRVTALVAPLLPADDAATLRGRDLYWDRELWDDFLFWGKAVQEPWDTQASVRRLQREPGWPALEAELEVEYITSSHQDWPAREETYYAGFRSRKSGPFSVVSCKFEERDGVLEPSVETVTRRWREALGLVARYPGLRRGPHELWMQLASPSLEDQVAWQSAGLAGTPDLQWELVVPDQGALKFLGDPAQERALLVREASRRKAGPALDVLLSRDEATRVVDLSRGVLLEP